MESDIIIEEIPNADKEQIRLIAPKEVVRVIKHNMKLKKAPGYDLIKRRSFKTASKESYYYDG